MDNPSDKKKWALSTGDNVMMRFPGISRHSKWHETMFQVGLWMSTRDSCPLVIWYGLDAQLIFQLSDDCSQSLSRGHISMICVEIFSQWAWPLIRTTGRSPCSCSWGISSKISSASLCWVRMTRLEFKLQSEKLTWPRAWVTRSSSSSSMIWWPLQSEKCTCVLSVCVYCIHD